MPRVVAFSDEGCNFVARVVASPRGLARRIRLMELRYNEAKTDFREKRILFRQLGYNTEAEDKMYTKITGEEL